MPPKTKTEPKKAKATKATPPAVPEPEPVEQEKKVVTVESVMDELAKMKELHAQVGKMIQATTQMVKKLSKTMQPKKKRTRKAQTAPSGFARPGPITHELSTFLGIPKGEPVARTTVTKQMSAYIKDKGLQNPERKREIVLDDNLAKLFKMKVSDTIEYFEIQKLLKNHYIKTTA
jgi:chromatin remodeling complex protein RSC6